MGVFMTYRNPTDVGLLTWHYYKNIGSSLQAYAMQTVVEGLGYTCAFINYRGEQRDSIAKTIIRSFFSIVGKYAPAIIPENIRAESYRFQQDRFHMTKPIYGKKNIYRVTSSFKMFICGSDQIWAPNVLNDVYLFSFLDDNQKRYSYAASIGLNDIPPNLDHIYSQYLNKFEKITVREQLGCDLLKSKYGIKAQCVLDPTFLLEAEEWKKIAKTPKAKNKFIFCYFLGENREHKCWVKKLQKRTGYDVICLADKKNEHIDGWECHYRMGPERFLGYLQFSEFVVTDSFHGIALSINLQKSFYAVERFKTDDDFNQNSRIYNILNLAGLNQQLLCEIPTDVPHVDYKLACKKIEIERKQGREMLKTMLSDCCGKRDALT